MRFIKSLVTIIILVILISGCSKKPVCGNGIVEEGETIQNCCEDMGCLGEQNCEDNRCIEPVCSKCQYLEEHICISYACCTNLDCDDSNEETEDICVDAKTRSAECEYQYIKDERLDIPIAVDGGFPPGGVSYINWEFEDDFERLDINVNIIEFDTSKYFYLQFYQSTIGDDGFYFGIQNRVTESDQMLIFSRWGARDLDNVEVNIDKEGFSQSAGYEGDFVGVRLPIFELKEEEYTFSIIKDKEEDLGSWYKYVVTAKSTGAQTWGGSIRFDKGAKISKFGSTWTELYGAPWPIQTYRYLPNWDLEIKSIKGDNIISPIHITSSYSDPNWGDHIPMEDISYDPVTGSTRMRLGPKVERENDAGKII